MVAAIVLGPEVLPAQGASASFDFGALTAGAIFGIVIYLVNFCLVASFAFEWFAEARNCVSLETHLLFGLVTAWAFVKLSGTTPRSAVSRGPTTPG